MQTNQHTSTSVQQKIEQNEQNTAFQNINYSEADFNKGPDYLIDTQQKIRQFYLQPIIKPQYFCSYSGFARVFKTPNIYQAYKSQNSNIIEMHFKYYQFIHEKLTVYKWVPSIIVASLTRFNTIGLVFPLVYTYLVDLYFKKFFIWKHSTDKIINIQPQFATKLTKDKNILRRALLFGRLKNDLATTQSQIPLKYIKYGETTQYIFHTKIKDTQQSSIYLTSAFENYMSLKNFGLQTVKQLGKHFVELKQSFKAYKKIEKKDQLPIFINYQKLLGYKDIKSQQIYTLTKQIELRIRRMLEIAKYQKQGKVFMSGFTFTDLLHLNKHYDLLNPYRYNNQSNMPDLVLFYGTIMTFKLMKLIIKRAVKM